MNKKVVIALSVLLLLLIGGGTYFIFTKNKRVVSPVPLTNTPTYQTSEPTAISQRSLKDLLATGIPQKCTYRDTTDQANITGTTYIQSGKVRGDFTTTTADKTSVGHTIFDGKTSYVWIEGTSTGFKMEIDPSATEASASSQQGLDLDKTFDFNCSPWLPDTSFFDPPGNVTFSAFAIPSVSVSGKTTGNPSLCDSCSALTGEQKTQCLSALKCN